MTAYALAHLFNPNPHPEVIEYIERIQATLEPYGGAFIAHGPTVDVKEGEWPGTVVVVEFRELDRANAWYDSPAYREILPLRADNIAGNTIIFDGVGPDYDARHTAAALRAMAARLPTD
ncbi:MAG TPA: DUF1330 domain-containing protein [Acidimicrobiales bacterium]|nr:DUF1330 domain-containing protein [Acidimicrobiales bacterium]